MKNTKTIHTSNAAQKDVALSDLPLTDEQLEKVSGGAMATAEPPDTIILQRQSDIILQGGDR